MNILSNVYIILLCTSKDYLQLRPSLSFETFRAETLVHSSRSDFSQSQIPNRRVVARLVRWNTKTVGTYFSYSNAHISVFQFSIFLHCPPPFTSIFFGLAIFRGVVVPRPGPSAV